MAHEHHQEHGDVGGDDLRKLQILLPHWIEHNQEHAGSFREWAARARYMGLEEVAIHIEMAVEKMEACNEALGEAIGSLDAQ